MSYDLYLVTCRRPGMVDLLAALPRRHGVAVDEGSLDDDEDPGVNLRGEGDLWIEIHGPTDADADFLNEVGVQRPVGSPEQAWWTEFCVPVSSAEGGGIDLARSIALELAGACQGVVHDPQSECTLSP